MRQESTERHRVAGAEEKTSAAMPAAKSLSQADSLLAMGIVARHIQTRDLGKLREQLPSMPFCQVVEELQALQHEVTHVIGVSSRGLEQARQLYLKRIREQYDLAAAAIGAEAFTVGETPTLQQAIDLAEHLNSPGGEEQLTPLHRAVIDGRLKQVENLVALGVDVNAQNGDGWTALTHAAEQGHNATVQVLLKAPEIDVDQGDGEVGSTPLMYAARQGHEAVMQTLLAAKANVNATDALGWTALMHAADSGQEGAVRLLVGVGGIDLAHRNAAGQTAQEIAEERGHAAIASLLAAAQKKKSNGAG